MNITATLINLYHVCHREMWLHANGIRMEHTSETVAEGKLIGETSYNRRADRWREVQIDGIKIDFYDPDERVVHEIKKSDKMEQAHLAQVKYYLYILEQNGIEGATGLLEYPKLKKTERVTLTDEDRADIPRWQAEIRALLACDTCPPRLNKPRCKSCSYYDWCYSE